MLTGEIFRPGELTKRTLKLSALGFGVEAIWVIG